MEVRSWFPATTRKVLRSTTKEGLSPGRKHMTLYIAWILLYHFNMEWWWYGGAFLAYVLHIGFQIYLARFKYKEPGPKWE